MGVKVITDSTSYIPRPLRASLDIGVVSLSSEMDGVSYADDAEDYTPFYTALGASGAFPTTSQPSVQSMVDLMEERVSAGHAVVGVFISELMSGTYSTAILARGMVQERHPDAVIEVVDSRSNCMELGFAALAAARTAAEGGSVEQVVEAANEMTGRTRFLFTPPTLEYLRRGGRIGNASALLGSLLQIRPILTVVDGVIEPLEKVLGGQRALARLVQLVDEGLDRGHRAALGIIHADAEEQALRVKEALEKLFKFDEVIIAETGPAIAANVGPGAYGVMVYQY